MDILNNVIFAAISAFGGIGMLYVLQLAGVLGAIGPYS